MQKYKAKPAFNKKILHQFSASVYVFLLDAGVTEFGGEIWVLPGFIA